MLPKTVDQQGVTLGTKGNSLPETLFQELPIGVLVMGAQSEIRSVNQAALNLLGLTESQLLDQTPLDPDWHVIQEDGTPFQLKLQSAPVRARQALVLLCTGQSLRNLVLGIYRPNREDKLPTENTYSFAPCQTTYPSPIFRRAPLYDNANSEGLGLPGEYSRQVSQMQTPKSWGDIAQLSGAVRALLRKPKDSPDRVWLSVNTVPQLNPDGSLEQVICTLSDITNLKVGEQLSKLHQCFLSLGSDPDENINRLTALAGELLGGTWALYNRLHQGLLWSLGQWRTPPDFSSVAEPESQICHEVIGRKSNEVFVLQDLQNTSYAQSNLYVVPYALQTYVGQAVKCAGEYIGSLCLVYQNYFVPTEADNKLMGIIAAAIGVEEERKREAVVWAQNEAKWRALIHNSSNLITILEPHGTIRYISPVIQDILGYKPGELKNKNIFEFVHPDDVSLVKSKLQDVLQNPTTSSSIEFRFLHKDGSWRYIDSTHTHLIMDGPVARIVVNSRDVTERKLTEVALKQSEAQLREKASELEATLHELQETQSQLIQTEKMSSLGLLVAGIAHEINNPVSFIYGNIPHATEYTQDLLHLLNLYRKNYPQPVQEIQDESEEIDLDFLSEDLPKVMESMQVGAERIRQIVLSLKTFSRVDRSIREAIDLHQGIDDTLLLLQHRLKAKAERPGIQVIKEYGDLPLVECYAGQINQVLMNVLSNAIDALEEVRQTNPEEAETNSSHTVSNTPKNPSIRISTEVRDNNTVVIKIADNGNGMSSVIQQHIFDPFFTTKSVGKGTGLGLSISYQIVVDKHGGQIKCCSTPGEGTEFLIELPV